MGYNSLHRLGARQHTPFLACRESEHQIFQKLLKQDVVTDNLMLTGLRGVGKALLLESLKSYAVAENWTWVGINLDENCSLTESELVNRLCADLALLMSGFEVKARHSSMRPELDSESQLERISFDALSLVFRETPGLPIDKLKRLIDFACDGLLKVEARLKGVVFAFDEAQNLTDRAEDKQFPLSLVLDTFQSLQRTGLPIVLVLSALPSLNADLLDTRGFAERMFKFVNLD